MLGTPGLFDGLDHLEAFRAIQGQRLLAKNHLLVRGGRQGDFRMGVVRRANVDDVDIFALDHLPPVGLGRVVAPLVRERLGLLGSAARRSS